MRIMKTRIKLIISSILTKFIKKYNLHAYIGDGKDVLVKIDKPILFPKDDQFHNIHISFNLKRNKAKAYRDGKLIK